MKALDIAGGRFGRLTALRRDGHINGSIAWKCLCECGNGHRVKANYLVSGHTASCGCLARERAAASRRSHGMSCSTEYKSWSHMHQRCSNPNCVSFKDYGSRGIKVCERWDNFELFLTDMGRKPTRSHTIDRINGSLGYHPDNCRWATSVQQASNRRSNRLITFNGETACQAEWCRRRGFKSQVISNRIDRGWSVSEAIISPLK